MKRALPPWREHLETYNHLSHDHIIEISAEIPGTHSHAKAGWGHSGFTMMARACMSDDARLEVTGIQEELAMQADLSFCGIDCVGGFAHINCSGITGQGAPGGWNQMPHPPKLQHWWPDSTSLYVAQFPQKQKRAFTLPGFDRGITRRVASTTQSASTRKR